jgi:hypothetical protein
MTKPSGGPPTDLIFVGCGYLERCPRDWESLTYLGSQKQRHCSTCDRRVYRCDSEKEFQLHARDQHCVAFSTAIFAKSAIPIRLYLGVPAMHNETSGNLVWD